MKLASSFFNVYSSMKFIRIRRNVPVAALAAVVTVFGASLGCPPEEEAPTAAALWQRIAEDEMYEDWAQFPEAQGVIDSAFPHGPFARVFVNDVVEAVVLGQKGLVDGELPNGSIVVKESFDEDMNEAGDGIAVMWKVEGFSPDDNDWFWATFSFEGDVREQGAVFECRICHGSRVANDFVFLHDFDKRDAVSY